MTYEVIEQRLKMLPSEAMKEIENYIEYVCDKYENKRFGEEITDSINAFIKNNPLLCGECFCESEVGIKRIRELTQNDSW